MSALYELVENGKTNWTPKPKHEDKATELTTRATEQTQHCVSEEPVKLHAHVAFHATEY